MIKGKMTGIQVVEKQEEYRHKTIALVERMINEGQPKNVIAEECGLSKTEVSSIEKIIN